MSVGKDKASLSLPEKDLNTVDDCSLSECIHRRHAVLTFSALFCDGALKNAFSFQFRLFSSCII